MDIVRILTLAHLKASLGTLKPKQKIYLLVFLLSLFLHLIPHETYAATIRVPTVKEPILVFDTSDKSYQLILDSMSSALTNNYADKKVLQKAAQKARLENKVKEYLQTQKSPLADYTSTLISLRNWKQIVALSNAESSMCRNYPKQTANCWGVGGSQLWDMGQTLADGILSMNNFLNHYPMRSPVKYAQMTFKQMNGLYKQPAAEHWRYNAQKIYDDLSKIEKSVYSS